VSRYVRESKAEVYDWLEALGVRWSGLVPRFDGNSVQRQHQANGRGLGLVSPIYAESLRWPNIRFVWNTKVTSLLIEAAEVRGVHGVNLRDGLTNEFRARSVVLATGGFESNLELVRQYWPATLPNLVSGATILLGSGINSIGSGLEVAATSGAALTNLDHQLFYSSGLLDPSDSSGKRGLNSFNTNSIWVNAQGRRFVKEITAGASRPVPEVLQQRGASYWSIFDARGRAAFYISGSGWDDTNRVQERIFKNPNMVDWVKRANSIEDLARACGLLADVLAHTIRRWNEMVADGEDTDWHRFGRSDTNRPPPITTPPFFAVKYVPLSRKSMGGVAVDLSCRVLDRGARPIPNLYAVGELAGVGGINGRSALEGTMLGPGLFMGRIAARAIIAHLKSEGKLAPQNIASAPRNQPDAPKASDPKSLRAWREVLTSLIDKPRPGYRHFEKVHARVLEQSYDCARCHRETSPLTLNAEQLDRHGLIRACVICHGTVKD
jgi:succinate dehydrogenase/fumarate reductase flavoprotein subunit